MNKPILTITPTNRTEFKKVVGYFFDASEAFHQNMGVDKKLLGKESNWYEPFEKNLALPDEGKDRFFLTWKIDKTPIGHAHINKIKMNEIACIHLHIWDEKNRKRGFGTEFIKMSSDYAIKRFRLKSLLCEPYTGNSAPNQTLINAGFQFVGVIQPMLIPGKPNYKRAVNRYIFEP